MAEHPILVEIDLPTKAVHKTEKGFGYARALTGPDSDFTLSNVWRTPERTDGGSRCALLQPLQLTQTFKESEAGLMRRLRLLDYRKDDNTAPLATDWDSVEYSFVGDVFLFSRGINQPLTTAKRYRHNQAFFFRTLPVGQYGQNETLFILEWGRASISADGVSQYILTVQYDGTFTLKKRHIEWPEPENPEDEPPPPVITSPIVKEGRFTPEGGDHQELAQKWVELMILPSQRNEILLWSNLGQCPVFVDEDIDPLVPNGPTYEGATVDPTADPEDEKAERYTGMDDFVITEEGHARVTFPNSKAYYQLTPLCYQTDASGAGTIDIAQPVKLPYAPNEANFPEGEDFASDIKRDVVSGTGVVFASNLDLDGVDDEMAWQLTLLGHRPDSTAHPTQADRTPFVHSVTVTLPSGQTEIPGAVIEHSGMVRRLHRTYTENGSSCVIEFKDPRSISEQWMKGLNRFCRIYQQNDAGGTDELFYGVATEPIFDQWPHKSGETDHTPVEYRVEDFWRRFAHKRLVGFQSLDGMTVSDAVKEILKFCGWDMTRIDIDELDYRLPFDDRDPEPYLQAAETKTAKDLLLYLRDAFTSANKPPYTWIMDFAPVLTGNSRIIKFRFKDPDLLSVSPTRTLYPRGADAAAAFPALAEDLQREHICFEFRRETLEPEANWIICTATDANRKAIGVQKYDKAAMDPDLPIADRPNNWIGEPREIVIERTDMNTKAQLTRLCDTYYKRLVPVHFLAEWEAPALSLDRLWDLHRFPHDEGGRNYHVREISIDHILEASGDIVRRGYYTGEARA